MMFGKFLLRCAVGVGVATVVTGGQVLPVMFMAVVCTAGLGLIVVVPVAYMIGLVCTIWFIPFGRGRTSANGAESEPLDPTTPVIGTISGLSWKYQVALVDFVKQATARGQNWPRIKTQLEGAGWSEDALAFAYGAFKKGLEDVPGV